MSNAPDLSNLIGMLNNKGFDINNLMQNMSNKNAGTSTVSSNAPSLDEILYNNSSNKTSDISSNSYTNTSDFQMPDIETISKIMKLMNTLNSDNDNPSANLLASLKPFLRDSKKDKVDQYIKLLKISSVFSEINKSGGDQK